MLQKKKELAQKMDNYYKEKDDGYVIRSKLKWKNEGERSTKFFFNLEKSQQSSNVIRRLRDNHGNFLTSDSDILEHTCDFYKNLFSSKRIPQDKINTYLNNTNFDKKITQQEKLMCDEKITSKELDNVIKNLKVGKSPGCDGITTEFYKKFWHLIKIHFMEMLNETFEQGELPYTMRKALLALLYKKGDDTLLKNYRPISLTNYDYKILCFVLANRLQKVLHNIIHEDQTGYIKKRYIGSNARLLDDYFEHCENSKIPGVLLMLDFEKAFDSIEWNLMYEVLQRFNFGNNFIKWVKILYEKPVISIKNNGWNSGDIDLERGVRQGCALSALIFVLSVEVMAINIRDNPNINGFVCNDREIKNSLYADDTTLLLRNLESLDVAIDTVNKFSAVAGPKLNKDKTEGILLGTLKNTVIEYSGIKFTNNAVRALGVYIGHDRQKCYEKNWTNKLEKIKIIFERWKNRNLTLFGKILIIKSLASSILIHTMSIIVTPEEVLKEIEKLIFNFLWNSTDRIKRKTLIGSKRDGGIKMLDIFCKDKALKAGWFRRLHTKNVNSDYLNMLLQRKGLSIDYLLKTNCTNHKLFIDRLKIPKFWAQVFASINECKDLRPFSSTSDYNFLSAPLWFNEQFKFKNKHIFLPNWAKSNIL